MYLLDTGVVFELRNAKAGRTDAGLAAWAAGIPREDMFISALALLELEDDAARLERKDKAAGAALRGWIGDQVMRAFDADPEHMRAFWPARLEVGRRLAVPK